MCAAHLAVTVRDPGGLLLLTKRQRDARRGILRGGDFPAVPGHCRRAGPPPLKDSFRLGSVSGGIARCAVARCTAFSPRERIFGRVDTGAPGHETVFDSGNFIGETWQDIRDSAIALDPRPCAEPLNISGYGYVHVHIDFRTGSGAVNEWPSETCPTNW